MPSYVTPRKNTALILYVGLEDKANPGLFKAAPTLAVSDFKVSIDGGTLNNLTDLPTVTPTGGRMVKITLTAAEMNGDNVTVVCSDAAGAEWYDLIVSLQTTARQIDDLAYPTVSGRGLDVAATGEAGLDFDNVKAATGATVLTNVTVPTVTTLTNMPAAAPSASDNATAAAAAILVTPANKLATGAGGSINSVSGSIGGDVGGKVLGGGAGVFVADGVQVAASGGTGLTAQETADAVNNLAPASTGATGSIRAKLDAIKLITDAIDTSAVTVTASNDAGVLTIIQAVTFNATVSGLTISGTWAKVYWSLKENIYDDDSEAIIQLVASNPAAALTDGLLYLDGAAIVTPITRADGTLTVNQAGGSVAIVVTDNATVLLDAASELVWDVKTKDSAGNTVQNTTGTASIVRAVTQTI